LIEKAIIDEHVRIGNNVKLINEKKLDRYDGQGIFIRDGIIIVTAGAVLPDGFVL
jgi:glucose-1-phosphate adenylyltransferase